MRRVCKNAERIGRKHVTYVRAGRAIPNLFSPFFPLFLSFLFFSSPLILQGAQGAFGTVSGFADVVQAPTPPRPNYSTCYDYDYSYPRANANANSGLTRAK
jgi:hypothetical protein